MQLIIRRDCREMLSTTAFRIIILAISLVTVTASTGISIALRLQSWYGMAAAAPGLNLILGLIAYFLPFVILITFIWGFASFQITNEKVNGIIECLLATPLDPRDLWMGKCIAIFAPSYIIALVASFITLLVVNVAAILPGWGITALPIAALVNGLIINPLLFFALIAFVVLFSLVNNPDLAAAPSLLIGFGMMIGMPVAILTGVIDITSWSFTLWYLAGTVVFWAVVLYLARLLTRQNIVLSSKGTG